MVRQEVHGAFHHEVRHLLAVAAHRLPGRLVGGDEGAGDLDVGHVVDGGEDRGGDERHGPAVAGADRADVGYEHVAEGDDAARRVGRDLEAVALLAAMAEETVAAVLHVGDRAAQQARQEAHQRLLRVPRHLVAEGAAHRRRDHAHVGFPQAEGGGDQPAARVRVLEGAGERQAAGVRRPVADVAERLHGRGGGGTERHLAAHHVRRRADRRLGVAGAHAVGGDDVGSPALVHHRRARGEGGLGVAHRLQNLVAHRHALGRRLRRLPALGHHGRDRLAGEAGHPGGEGAAEHRAGGYRAAGVRLRQGQHHRHGGAQGFGLGALHNRHYALHAARLARLHGEDARACVRAAHQRHVEGAGRDEVGGVAHPARDEAQAVQAGDGTADPAARRFFGTVHRR